MCLVWEFFCLRFHLLLALKSDMTQMMTIKQFTDLRDGKCLKKLSNPISSFYALFYTGGNWSQETQEVSPGQPINVNDKIITPIPCLLVHRRNENESDSNYLTVKFNKRINWLYELEAEGLPCGTLVIHSKPGPPNSLPLLSLWANIKSTFSSMCGLGWTENGHRLNKVLLLSWNSPTTDFFKLILFYFLTLLNTHTASPI